MPKAPNRTQVQGTARFLFARDGEDYQGYSAVSRAMREELSRDRAGCEATGCEQDVSSTYHCLKSVYHALSSPTLGTRPLPSYARCAHKALIMIVSFNKRLEITYKSIHIADYSNKAVHTTYNSFLCMVCQSLQYPC